MSMFNFIDDVEAYLEPMDYETFWREIKPFCLILKPRDYCDEQIASGVVDEETVLEVLKYLARIELTRILKLHWNIDPKMSKTRH
jgi:hypothetical protein